MSYSILNSVSNPVTESQYQEFLTVAFEECDFFSVCTFKRYHKKDLSENYFAFFQALSQYEKEAFPFQLPKHYERGQAFHVYELNEVTKRMIRNVGSFSGWFPPDYPEDLAFFKGKKLWFSSVSHEHLLFLETDEKRTAKRLTQLGLNLAELGPEIE